MNSKSVKIILCALSLASCSVDSAFDLSKDIDLNITVGGDTVVLPYCSTDTFSLARIIEIDSTNNVYINTGVGNAYLDQVARRMANTEKGDFYYYKDEGNKQTYKTYTTGTYVLESNVVHSMSLRGLPEILKKGNARMDVKDVFMYLNVDNPGDNQVEFTNCKLYGVKHVGGERIVNSIDLNDLTIPPRGLFTEFDGLSKVLVNVPDTVYFSGNAKQSSSTTQIYGYNISVVYGIAAPFAFGDNFQIVYTDSVLDMNKCIDDYSVQQLVMTAEVENEVPLNMHLEAVALDVDGKEMKDVEVTFVNDIAAATSDTGEGTATTIKALIKGKSRDSLKRFNGLRYEATGYSTNRQKGLLLMGHQTIKVNKVSLAVVGGVDLDLN